VFVPSFRTPSYRLHKPSGQAVVTLSGRVYLGRFGSTASRAEYDRRVAEWLATAGGSHVSATARVPTSRSTNCWWPT
jgi:hypothetical protein